MKRTNTMLVAILALAVSTSAFAVGGKGREGKGGKDAKETRTEIGRTNESAGSSKGRVETLNSVKAISKTMNIESMPALASLKLSKDDVEALNEKTAKAFDDGLIVRKENVGSFLKALEEGSSKEEFKALYANIQILAGKNKLTDANLKWTENVDGKSVEINSMTFITGEALSIAKGSSPKLVQFLNLKTQMEKEGLSTKEATMEALKRVGISFEEFVRRCLVK